MNIAFFGSSLVSAYWNGAATYYRGIIRALAGRGHQVTFYEPDAFSRQAHRDMDDPDWARVVVYSAEGTDELDRALAEAQDADVVVKASGVGVFDELLEQQVLKLKRAGTQVAFWDVDAPATLERLAGDSADPFKDLIPQFDWIFTYGGGPPVVQAYRSLCARECLPIYNALDPLTHYPVAPDRRFEGLLAFLGNRLPDREARVEEFFFRPARALPDKTFILGGSGWDEGISLPPNVRYVGHVFTRDHNAMNCTPRAVLNISRQSMARFGHSPATRVFEAAGAGACLLTDAWEGVEAFLEPQREVLVCRDGKDVVEWLTQLSPERARQIGAAARNRVLAQHTYDHRVARLIQALAGPGDRASMETTISV